MSSRARLLSILIAGLFAIPSGSLFCAPPSKSQEEQVSRIPRQPIASSALAAVGYSKRLQILEIEFLNGAIYRYLDVPRSVYHRLMAADSKAGYYDRNIRGNFRSVRIRPYQAKISRN